MKKRNSIFVKMMLVGCCFLLSSCNLFGGSNDSSSDETGDETGDETNIYEYSAKDIRYYKKSGEQITKTTVGSRTRNYFKCYDGYCAVAIANIDGYFGPVLVGEDKAQVCYSTDYDDTIVKSSGSVDVNGKTYYYSKNSLFLAGTLDGKNDYNNYFSKYTTLEEVAKDVASQATFVPVDESLKKEYIYSEEDDGTLTIKAGPYFQDAGKVELPSELDGKKVTRIADGAFKDCKNLKEIVIPDGITNIGTEAFYGCSKLNRIYVPTSTIYIGVKAFDACATDLYVFCGVTQAQPGYKTDSWGPDWDAGIHQVVYNTKYYKENDLYLYAELKDETIIISLYKGNENEITIPEKLDEKIVSTIDRYSFSENENIKSVNFPSGLLTIKNSAFNKCINLKEVVLPFGLKEIYGKAFYGCSKLCNVYIPSSTVYIGIQAFDNCSTSLYVFLGVTQAQPGYKTDSWGPDWDSGIYKITYNIKNYVDDSEYLYAELLDGSLVLTHYKGSSEKVIIPSSINGKDVSIIGHYCFENNENIREVSIPDSIVEIRRGAFINCIAIEKIKIPFGVKSIGINAFNGCKKLCRVFVSSTVEAIGVEAFQNCSADLYLFCACASIPSGYQTDSWGPDWNSGVKKVIIKSNGYIDYENCLYNIQLSSKNLTLVSYKKNEYNYVSLPDDGLILYNEDKYTITSMGTALKGDQQVHFINIPETVTTIPSYCFDGCSNLKIASGLNFAGITYIGDYAFRNTKLTEVRLPREMKYLGEGAFYGTNFELVRFSGTTSEWKKIEKNDGSFLDFVLNSSWRKGSKISTIACTDGYLYY